VGMTKYFFHVYQIHANKKTALNRAVSMLLLNSLEIIFQTQTAGQRIRIIPYIPIENIGEPVLEDEFQLIYQSST
jgi:hypothetical protein